MVGFTARSSSLRIQTLRLPSRNRRSRRYLWPFLLPVPKSVASGTRGNGSADDGHILCHGLRDDLSQSGEMGAMSTFCLRNTAARGRRHGRVDVCCLVRRVPSPPDRSSQVGAIFEWTCLLSMGEQFICSARHGGTRSRVNAFDHCRRKVFKCRELTARKACTAELSSNLPCQWHRGLNESKTLD